MTAEKFQAILAKQMPDSEKRRRAHFLIETRFGFAHAERRVRAVLRAISGRSGRTE
jgi:dephospho-CoA kinase